MFCPNCGKVLPEGGKFCTACGTRIQAPAEAPAPQTPPPQPCAAPAQSFAPPAQPYAPPVRQPGEVPVYAAPAQPYGQAFQQPEYAQPNAPAEAPPKKKKKLWLWITLAAVLLAGVGVGLFFLLRGGKGGAEGKYVMSRFTGYDAQGNVSVKGEYQLDKDGNPTHLDRYDKDGNLEFTVDATCDSKGNVIEQKSFMVENGEKIFNSWRKMDCNENGDPLEIRDLDEDGSLRSRYTYTYDADGNETAYCYYNREGIMTGRTQTTYDEKGKKLTERNFDEDGEESSLYEYENQYDADGHLIKATVYYSSAWSSEPHRLNSWTEYFYDADGHLARETKYDADGVVEEAVKYNADGNATERAYYNSGRESWRYVSEYDSHGNLIKETDYNDGKLEGWYVIEYRYFE